MFQSSSAQTCQLHPLRDLPIFPRLQWDQALFQGSPKLGGRFRMHFQETSRRRDTYQFWTLFSTSYTVVPPDQNMSSSSFPEPQLFFAWPGTSIFCHFSFRSKVERSGKKNKVEKRKNKQKKKKKKKKQKQVVAQHTRRFKGPPAGAAPPAAAAAAPPWRSAWCLRREVHLAVVLRVPGWGARGVGWFQEFKREAWGTPLF